MIIVRKIIFYANKRHQDLCNCASDLYPLKTIEVYHEANNLVTARQYVDSKLNEFIEIYNIPEARASWR